MGRSKAATALRIALFGATFPSALVAFSATARADASADAKRCIADNEQGGALRSEGKLSQAKERYLACTAATCPAVVRDECQSLLERTEASIPTVVFAVVDENGVDISDAQLFLDDAPAPEALDGRARTIDPGQHKIRVRAGKGKASEETVTIREGEKNRTLTTTIVLKPPPTVTPPPPPKPAAKPSPVISTPVIVLGAVAAVGLGSFGYLALKGKGQEGDLRDQCAPNCSNAKIDDMYRSYLFADISLGVAVAAAGTAAYLFFRDQSANEKSPATDQARLPIDIRVGRSSAAVALTLNYQ